MMIRIKQILAVALAVLLLMSLSLAASASFSGDSAVTSVTVDAVLRADGSAVVSESWELSFSENSDGSFSRVIPKNQDSELDSFGSINDISVSVDGNICTLNGNEPMRSGQYSLQDGEDSILIQWYPATNNGVHSYSLRYILTDAVKLYKDRAYYNISVSNEGQILSNVTLRITAPEKCYSDEILIAEAGVLAGKKFDGGVEFSAPNTSGTIGAAITMPATIFDTGVLHSVADNSGIKLAITVVLIVLLVIVLAIVIRYFVMRNKLFRERWLKRCKRAPLNESLESSGKYVLRKLSPADVLFIVSDGVVSQADYFIVTALDLAYRGYITVESDGFVAMDKSDEDMFIRRLSDNEHLVLDCFRDNIEKLISNPEEFFISVNGFNKKIKGAGLFTTFTKDGNKLIRRAFEMRILSKRYDFVPCEEISDDFFSTKRYTPTDLIISVINEYYNSLNEDFIKPDVSRFQKNLFMLRDTYRLGERAYNKRMALKKQKKTMEERDDD